LRILRHSPTIHEYRFGGIHVCCPVRKFPLQLDAGNGAIGFDAAERKPSLHRRAATSLQRGRVSADIPDVDRITACMIRNKSQLTPGCRAFFRGPEPAATPVAAGKPLSIRPANAGKGVSAKPHTPKKPAKPGAT